MIRREYGHLDSATLELMHPTLRAAHGAALGLADTETARVEGRVDTRSAEARGHATCERDPFERQSAEA